MSQVLCSQCDPTSRALRRCRPMCHGAGRGATHRKTGIFRSPQVFRYHTCGGGLLYVKLSVPEGGSTPAAAAAQHARSRVVRRRAFPGHHPTRSRPRARFRPRRPGFQRSRSAVEGRLRERAKPLVRACARLRPQRPHRESWRLALADVTIEGGPRHRQPCAFLSPKTSRNVRDQPYGPGDRQS